MRRGGLWSEVTRVLAVKAVGMAQDALIAGRRVIGAVHGSKRSDAGPAFQWTWQGLFQGSVSGVGLRPEG